MRAPLAAGAEIGSRHQRGLIEPAPFAPGCRSEVSGAGPERLFEMAHRFTFQALNDICLRFGGNGGHTRTVRALNEWAVLLGGAGGHARNLRALNEICVRLGAAGGHLRSVLALNEISVRLGGGGGHLRNLAALDEIDALAAQSGGAASGWQQGPITLFGAGDSRFAEGRQGTPPYDSGYVLHRYSAFNLAVWSLQGRVIHDARRHLFATSGCTTLQWIDTHMADLVAAMAVAANPVVVMHLGTDSLPVVPLAEMQDETAAIIEGLLGAGGRVVWLLENPRSGGNALSAVDEQKRRDYNAWLQAQQGRYAPGRFWAVNYLPDYTADGTTTGDTALSGLQRDDLHDTQSGASVKAAAVVAVLGTFRPIVDAPEYAGRADTYDAIGNPTGNRLSNGQMTGGPGAPTDWEGGVRNPGDTDAGSTLACTFSTETSDGSSWAVMQLGGTGGSGENARLYQAPYATGYAGGDTVRFRVRVRWQDLANVRAVKVVIFHYGDGFFGINTGNSGAGLTPGGTYEEVLEGAMVLSANPTFFQMKLMVEAEGTGPVSGTVRWAEAEIRKD